MKRLGYTLLTIILTVVAVIAVQHNSSLTELVSSIEKQWNNNVAVANTSGILSASGFLVLVGTFLYKNKSLIIRDLQDIKTNQKVEDLSANVEVLIDKVDRTANAVVSVAELQVSFARGTEIPEKIQDSLVNKLVEIKTNLSAIKKELPDIVEEAKQVVEEELKPTISTYYNKFKDSLNRKE